MDKESEIKVSICCITYNHEKYIEDAIKSFLNQKTNFKYEIIIRDDASTDNTAKIIKEYEDKYPDIIKPIYEKVNGRQRGVKSELNVTFDKAIGKYIAVCEGDDYWCDENKLQNQFDYMENNKDCTLCIHNAYKLNVNNNRFKKYNSKRDFYFIGNKTYKFDAGEMMLINLTANFATASMFFRKKDVIECPEFYFEAPCGDMPLKMITANKGYVYYDKKCMSVYRYNIGSSAMDGWFKEMVEEKIKRINRFKKLVNDFDKYSSYKYKNELELVQQGYDVSILLVEKKYIDIIQNKNYRKVYKIIHKDRFLVKMFVKAVFPKSIYILNRIRGRK